jgi:hypothetical protein
MRKTLLFILLFSSISSFAQEYYNKTASKDTSLSKLSELLMLTVQGGYVNPIGDFGSKDQSRAQPGQAYIGYGMGASVVLKVNKFVGLKAHYQYQYNPRDARDFGKSTMTVPAYVVSTRVTDPGQWTLSGFFGGVHLSTKIKTNSPVYVDVDLMIGLPKVTYPTIKGTYTYFGSDEAVEMTATPASAFAVLPALGMHYNFARNWTLNLNVSYISTEVTFDNITLSYSNGASVGPFKTTQRVSTINTQIGVACRLY